MSRSQIFEYRLHAADVGRRLDDLVGAVEAIIPPACWGAGFADASELRVSYYIRANKTKARRLAHLLDMRLGERGVLSSPALDGESVRFRDI